MRTFLNPSVTLRITPSANIENAHGASDLDKELLREIINKHVPDSQHTSRSILDVLKKTLGNAIRDSAVMASSMAMATALNDTVAHIYPDDDQKQQNMTFLFSLIASTSINLLSQAAQTMANRHSPDSFVTVQKNIIKDVFNRALGYQANNIDNLCTALRAHYYAQAKEAIGKHHHANLWIKEDKLNDEAEKTVKALVDEKIATALSFFRGEGLPTIKRVLLGSAEFSSAVMASSVINSQLNRFSFEGIKALRSTAAGVIGGASALGIAWAGRMMPPHPTQFFAMVSTMFATMTGAMEYFPKLMSNTVAKSTVNAVSGALSAATTSIAFPLMDSIRISNRRQTNQDTNQGSQEIVMQSYRTA